MNYFDKLKDPRWQKVRLHVMQRDGFICRSCQCDETELQVHHLQYGGDPWDTHPDLLLTVCKDCHEALEEAVKNTRLCVTKEEHVLPVIDALRLIADHEIDPIRTLLARLRRNPALVQTLLDLTNEN